MPSDGDNGCPNSKVRYPVCLRICPGLEGPAGQVANLSAFLQRHPGQCGNLPFLTDLARIEEARYRLQTSELQLPGKIACRIVNPLLELVEVTYLNLDKFLFDLSPRPVPGSGHVLVWIPPESHEVAIQAADARDLLALKLASEGIDSRTAAAEGNVSVGAIDNVLYRAQQKGLLVAPPSGIVRSPDFPAGQITAPEYFRSPTFTLQWHVTQACDLNCRHCYDRSDRKQMQWSRAVQVLDDFYDFCTRRHVFGQISFSGGNPMLYPHFDRLYQEAAERGFMTAVLGNPVPRAPIQNLLSLQIPEFYQVSLEGTRQHNDYIRGSGHFDRTMDFLEVLGELGVYRMVMLTLTRDNMDQVLDLADQLKGRTELFTFNRLAAVGQGARLAAVEPEEFGGFLERYMTAAASNDCMGFKDNLFNLVRWQKDLPLGGGCAGFGCGAAFNFAALLPDGEVHACRKLPSFIGNMYQQSLEEIYRGLSARRYRAGSGACQGCPIRPVCGSCLAVSHGAGCDIFKDPDPYCFRSRD